MYDVSKTTFKLFLYTSYYLSHKCGELHTTDHVHIQPVVMVPRIYLSYIDYENEEMKMHSGIFLCPHIFLKALLVYKFVVVDQDCLRT
jgi:hypothetical protein